MKDAVFCPNCDYAMDKILRDTARMDFLCARCGDANISMFYGYGSWMHRKRWRERGTSYRTLPYPFTKEEILKGED